MHKQNVRWTTVIVYYILACLFSWPFFIWRDVFDESWRNSGISGGLRNLALMWGPGLSAIICFLVFRSTHKRRITFKGTSLLFGLATYLLPFAAWFVLSLAFPENEPSRENNLLMLIPFGFAMILGEELGWRGFLQDALLPIKNEWKRWVLLGVMWEVWHCTRGIMGKDFLAAITFKLLMTISVILLTIIIGKLTEKTKSLFIGLAIHSWVNIQFEFDGLNVRIAGIFALLLWTVLIIKWPSKKSEVGQT